MLYVLTEITLQGRVRLCAVHSAPNLENAMRLIIETDDLELIEVLTDLEDFDLENPIAQNVVAAEVIEAIQRAQEA